VDEVPVVGEAVGRGVLAHGGDRDAVGEGEGAEGQGCEEAVRGLCHGDWMPRGGCQNAGIFWAGDFVVFSGKTGVSCGHFVVCLW
jgi:hypothetical protein